MSHPRIARIVSFLISGVLTVLAACASVLEPEAPAQVTAVPPLPAAFKTSNLTADPAMVLLGQLTMIGVIVTNTGAQADNGTVTMYFDGRPLKSQNITLAAGESHNVTFPLSSSQNGTHLIQIGESTFTLMVHVVDPNMMGDMGPM